MGREGLQGLSTSKSLTQNLAYEGSAWAPFLPPLPTPTSLFPAPLSCLALIGREEMCEPACHRASVKRCTPNSPDWGWRGFCLSTSCSHHTSSFLSRPCARHEGDRMGKPLPQNL